MNSKFLLLNPLALKKLCFILFLSFSHNSQADIFKGFNSIHFGINNPVGTVSIGANYNFANNYLEASIDTGTFLIVSGGSASLKIRPFKLDSIDILSGLSLTYATAIGNDNINSSDGWVFVPSFQSLARLKVYNNYSIGLGFNYTLSLPQQAIGSFLDMGFTPFLQLVYTIK